MSVARGASVPSASEARRADRGGGCGDGDRPTLDELVDARAFETPSVATRSAGDGDAVDAPELGTSTRCIGRRVDWLDLSYRVELDEHATRTLADRARVAREHGRAELDLRGLRCSLIRSDRLGFFPFGNSDLTGALDFGSRGGERAWNLRVRLHAMFLATHDLRECIATLHDCARAFGYAREVKIARVDLAADFVGWPMTDLDAARFVGTARRRGKITDFHPEPKDVDSGDESGCAVKKYRRADRVTGYTVCAGGDLQCRTYDKTEELTIAGRETKAPIERAGWVREGWTSELDERGVERNRVTRVEFQLRGSVLDDLDLRDPRELAARLDDVWQYGTRTWIRLAVPSESTPRGDRWRTDPRWEAAQRVHFVHTAGPATRVRKRGGATFKSTIGCAASMLAGLDELAPIDTRGLSEADYVAAWSPDEALDFVETTVRRVMGGAAWTGTGEIVGSDPHAAAVELVTKINATAARFATARRELDARARELADADGITIDDARALLTSDVPCTRERARRRTSHVGRTSAPAAATATEPEGYERT